MLGQLILCEDYQPLFYLDNTTTRNREISWSPSLDFLDAYLWEPLHPALSHTEFDPSRLFQDPLFPQGYKHVEHLIENPIQAIANSIIRLEKCLEHTNRCFLISDSLLQNLTIICSSNSAEGNDILQYTRAWTNTFPKCTQLSIPPPW